MSNSRRKSLAMVAAPSVPKACPFGQSVGESRPKYRVVEDEMPTVRDSKGVSADRKTMVMNCFEDGDSKDQALLKLTEMKRKAAEAKKLRENPTKYDTSVS